VPVELLDRTGCDGSIDELHEREAAGPTGIAICGYEDLADLTVLGKELLEIGLRGRKRKVPYEQFGCDVAILLAIARLAGRLESAPASPPYIVRDFDETGERSWS